MNNKHDKVNNWYLKIPKQFNNNSGADPTYKSHLIKPNSMVLCVGKSGSGKTNSIIEFLSRKNSRFYEIIIFTGSNTDEPLYNFLKARINGIQLIDDIKNLPKIENYKDTDKSLEKLLIFDDTIMLDKKIMKEIEKFYMMARKLGFTCVFLAQDYHSVSTFIRRNINYLQLFKMADFKDMKNILSKYCTEIDIDTLKNMLNYATNEPMNFLTIAINEPENGKYRRNFNEILNPLEFKI